MADAPFNWYIIGTIVIGITSIGLAHFLLGGLLFPEKKRKKDQPPGLVNVGSTTCYCNTILQCLAAVDSFKIWLDMVSKHHSPVILHEQVIELLQALSNLSEPEALVLSCEKLLSTIAVSNKFQLFAQQDCHEFFQLLCELLQVRHCPTGPSDFTLLNTSRNGSGNIGRFPLSGRTASRLNCSVCHTTSPTITDRFYALSLIVPAVKRTSNLPPASRLVTLSDLLDTYLADELLIDATCENCSSKSSLHKKNEIFSLPSAICFHIIRSDWTDHVARKRQDGIVFPQVIDLAPYSLYNTKTPRQYRLKSVIVHFGSSSATGHFASYRLSPSGRRWCFASDEEVRFVDRDTVFSCEPYMLFYERL